MEKLNCLICSYSFVKAAFNKESGHLCNIPTLHIAARIFPVPMCSLICTPLPYPTPQAPSRRSILQAEDHFPLTEWYVNVCSQLAKPVKVLASLLCWYNIYLCYNTKGEWVSVKVAQNNS